MKTLALWQSRDCEGADTVRTASLRSRLCWGSRVRTRFALLTESFHTRASTGSELLEGRRQAVEERRGGRGGGQAGGWGARGGAIGFPRV